MVVGDSQVVNVVVVEEESRSKECFLFATAKSAFPSTEGAGQKCTVQVVDLHVVE